MATQPHPIFTAVGSDDDGNSQIVRVWQPGDAATCRLCSRCSSFTLVNGVSFCYVQANREVAEGDAAALYDSTAPSRTQLKMFCPP
jgi:hypothetical protein